MKTKLAQGFPEQKEPECWKAFIEQQQQDPPEEKKDDTVDEVEDPFKDIDTDLLDAETKAKVLEAKSKFATIANQAKEAKGWKDKEVLMQKQIDDIRAQSNQQTQKAKTDAAPTMEEEIFSTFKEAGLSDDAAKANTKIQMQLLTKFGARMGNNIASHLAPIQQQSQETAASQMFQDVRSSDTRLQNDEIAEDVWGRITKMVAAGHMPTPQVIENFGKLAYVDYMDKNPDAPIPQKTKVPIRLNTQTRHTFPGAGHSPTLPRSSSAPEDALDAETRAALASTFGGWPVVPKGYEDKTKQVHVTRGN